MAKAGRENAARRSRRPSSRGSEQSGRPNDQHKSSDQIQAAELDLGKELNPGGSDKADDQSADQGAFEAAEAADDNDDKGQNQRLDPHAEHRGVARNDDRAAEAGHEAANRKCGHIDEPDIEPEGS